MQIELTNKEFRRLLDAAEMTSEMSSMDRSLMGL